MTRSMAAAANLQERFDGFGSSYRMNGDPRYVLTTASDATCVGRYDSPCVHSLSRGPAFGRALVRAREKSR